MFKMLKSGIIFIFLLTVGFGQSEVFITEIADPNNGATARFVELFI